MVVKKPGNYEGNMCFTNTKYTAISSKVLHLQKRAQERGKSMVNLAVLGCLLFSLFFFLVERNVTGGKRALNRNHRPWTVYTGKLLQDLQLTPDKTANVSNKIGYCEWTKTCRE